VCRHGDEVLGVPHGVDERGRGAARRGMMGEPEGPAPLHHLTGREQGRPFRVTYFTLKGAEQRLIGAVLLIWNLDHLRDVVLPAIFADGPPRAPEFFHGTSLAGEVGLELIDETGRRFYGTCAPAAGIHVAERPFHGVLEFWSVAIHLDDHDFQVWLRWVRLTFLALVVGMMGFIIATAVFLFRWLNREIEYAELRSSFVSNVSHELKTPLALIRLYAETLELDRVRDPDERRKFLNIISKETRRLAHLINNVLDVSRIEAGHKQYELEHGDIGAVVRETIDSYRYHLDEQGFQLRAELDDEAYPARVDARALTQALLNLLDNAVKYSGEEKDIAVTLRRVDGVAEISVADRGIGIPRDELERVFDTFYRVHHPGRQSQRGFGLGLPLVRHIVQAHGGSIRVDSDTGTGSTFTLVLPLADSQSDGA
jgi:signal transduction histidine kinase